MSLRNKTVPMPEKRITYKKAPNGTEYVYYTVRAYRNKNGKPTSDEVAIGKKDAATGDLIPNGRYYEIFRKSAPATAAPEGVRSCGGAKALGEVANQTGLAKILEECFPDRWGKMLACAYYMVCEGNVMMHIGDWFEETKVGVSEHMDDLECSRLFVSVTEEDSTKININIGRHKSFV